MGGLFPTEASPRQGCLNMSSTSEKKLVFSMGILCAFIITGKSFPALRASAIPSSSCFTVCNISNPVCLSCSKAALRAARVRVGRHWLCTDPSQASGIVYPLTHACAHDSDRHQQHHGELYRHQYTQINYWKLTFTISEFLFVFQSEESSSSGFYPPRHYL